jgi:hypothetical protein
LRHIHRNDPPGPRSPELIARISERSVYDLRDVRVDVFSRDGSSELINRARRAVELGYYPVAGRYQARVMEHVDHLLRRKTSADWQSSELARRILITGSPEYQQIFAKMVIAGLRGMPEASGLTREEQQLVQRAMAVGTGSAGGFAVPFLLDGTIVPTSNLNRCTRSELRGFKIIFSLLDQ